MLLTESRKMPSSARPPSSCTPVSDARACAGPWACPPSRLPQGAGLSLGAVLGETRGRLSSEPGPSSPVTTPPSAPAPSAAPLFPHCPRQVCPAAGGLPVGPPDGEGKEVPETRSRQTSGWWGRKRFQTEARLGAVTLQPRTRSRESGF